MSNLLNSFYSNLNDLISINATDITTDTINTNTLIINGSVFNSSNYVTITTLNNYVLITDLNNTLLYYVSTSQLNTILSSYATFSDLQITNSDVADLQFILTGCSYDNVYNFLNLSNNLHVFGTLMLGNPQTDIGYFISNTIPSTYATISSLSNYATTSSLSNYATISSLSNYATISSLSNYATISSLSNYATISSLSNYATISSLSNYATVSSLSNYATVASLSDLNTKTTNISYSSPKTTISNTTETNTLIFTGTFNGLSTNMVKSLQDMSGNISARFILDEGLISDNAVAIGAVSTVQIPLVQTDYNAKFATQLGLIGAVSDRTTTLEAKTTKMSYSPTTNRTSISSTTNIDNLEVGNLVSGLTQTVNSQVKLIGVLRLENQLTIASGFGIGVEGGIVQSLTTSSNSFASPVSMSNILTLTGSETNIKTTNLYISSNTIIKNTSTTSSGVVSPYLSVLSTSSNNNAKKLQGIVIGKEQVLNNQSNCNIGYNYLSDGSSGNYGYLGLNVNTLNTIESLRWFSTGVAVPVGDLTISTGNAIVTAGNLQISTGSLNTNTINNQSTNMTINSTNNLSLNSNTINIGANQAVGALNNINIGALTSLSNINLNGIVYAPLGLNMTGVGSIFAQW